MEVMEVNYNDDGDIIDIISGKNFKGYTRGKSKAAFYKYFTI